MRSKKAAHLRALVAMLFAFALVAAACGDSKGSSSSATTVSGPAATAGGPTTTVAETPVAGGSATIELFSQVMRRVKNSRLLMVLPATGRLRESRRERFAAYGVSPDRIDFISRGGFPQFLAAHQGCDIALDPTPCCGGITTGHALVMGLPVVSLMRDTPPSRAGLSLLSRVGLGYLASDSSEGYIAIASELAADLPKLDALRQDLPLRMRASTIMDAANHTRELERAYRQMWEPWTCS